MGLYGCLSSPGGSHAASAGRGRHLTGSGRLATGLGSVASCLVFLAHDVCAEQVGDHVDVGRHH